MGLSSYILPFMAPLFIFFALVIIILIAGSSANRLGFFVSISLSLLLFTGISTGLLSSTLAVAVLSAVFIATRNRELSFLILVLQVSYIASIEAILSNYLHTYHLEAAGPSILCGSAYLAIQSYRRFWWKILLVLFPLAIVKISVFFNAALFISLILCAIPVFLLIFLDWNEKKIQVISHKKKYVFISLVFFMALGWSFTPPKQVSDRYAFLPNNPDSPEYQFYDLYQEALSFSGMDIKVVKSLDLIPQNSLVLLPWMTSKDTTSIFLQQLGEYARARSWTVVLVGEHNNMGEVADRISTLTEKNMLRNDLSVPSGNTNHSGHLRIGSIRAWPPNALLNRGATIKIDSLLNRILLAGDGWWAEPDIEEWLWVGDYIWQPNDRHGRIVLAASMEDQDARWVLIGDTSPFINKQLVSNPTGAIRILELATLWPTFIKDVGIFIICILIILGSSAYLCMTVFGITILCGLLAGKQSSGKWLLLQPNLSAFDERNFNKLLLGSSELLTGRWGLVRKEGFISGKLELPLTPTVIFGLIEGDLYVDDVMINGCKRLGSLPTKNGPYLMDAQACLINGPADVLLGDKNGAAAIKIERHNFSLILVLDRNFLGQKAPSRNLGWLEEILYNKKPIKSSKPTKN